MTLLLFVYLWLLGAVVVGVWIWWDKDDDGIPLWALLLFSWLLAMFGVACELINLLQPVQYKLDAWRDNIQKRNAA